MDRYDIYDERLFPGDTIVYLRKGELHIGRISSISLSGSLSVFEWEPEKKQFSSIVRRVYTYKIIKPTPGMGVQIN